jgi:hypothetical protein
VSVCESLRVDALPIDEELRDAGTAGPELAYLAHAYLDSPRALIFRNPSSDWRLFLLLLPLATRLSLMTNPVFAQLTRAWGLNVRFLGVDRNGLVHDFRELLSDRTLGLLVEMLARRESVHQRADGTLDLLFAALAREMLTVLERRRPDWPRHLARDCTLDAGASLLDHSGRYPDFLAALRSALRCETIDVVYYGRVLRSIDLREAAIDSRIRAVVESALDPATMAKLVRAGATTHLGCYNWLRIEPARAATRAHLLEQLPAFATFFCEALLPTDAPLITSSADTDTDTDTDTDEGRHAREHERPGYTAGEALHGGFDLRRLAARDRTVHSLHWSAVLRRAIDAGQDRAAIEAIAQRFAVGDNVIRRIWRERPAALGRPPTWHLAQILRRLHATPERDWPATDEAWQSLIAQSVPTEAL